MSQIMSRKLKRYKDGTEYVTGGIASIEPNVEYQPEEYDLSDLTDKECERLKVNKKLMSLRKKMRKVENG